MAQQPLSVRQNNPGNMRGASGVFQSFTSPQEGLNAMASDLLLKIAGNSPAMKAKYGEGYQPTLRNLISTWAPSNENDTEGYINFVAKKTGLHPEQPLTQDAVSKLIPAMTQMEGGKAASIHFGQGTDYAQADTGPMTDAVPVNPKPNFKLMLEAEKRGILPSNKVALLAEARKRGLVPSDTQEQPEQPQEEKGFFGRSAEDISNRLAEGQGYAHQFNQGEIGLPRYLLRSIGNVTAGAANDILGEAAISVYKELPEIAQEGIKAVGNYAKPIIAPAAEAYSKLEKKYPETMKDVAGVVNIGTLLAPVGKAGQATETAVGKAGTQLVKSTETKMAAKKFARVQNLVLDDLDPSRMTQTKFGTNVYNPTDFEKEMIDEVAKIPGVGGMVNKSPQYALLKVQDAANKTGQDLVNKLSQLKVTFPKKEFNARIQNAVAELADNPILVGNAETTANRLIGEYYKILDKVPSTPAGLLRARKDFDKVATSFKPKVFDANTENVFSLVSRKIRNATNEFIAEKAPNSAVKDSLRKHHLLLTAKENLVIKAKKGAMTAIGRLAQDVGKVVPLKAEIAGLAGLVGAGAIEGTGPALGAAATYGAYKGATSPVTRKALGQLLVQTDKAMRLAKDKNLVNELRLNRMAVREALKANMFQDEEQQ